MLSKRPACIGCILEKDGKGFAVSEGRCSNGVLVVGEALGSNEVMDGLPLRPYAEAGSVFQTALRILQYERSNFGIFNLTNCQPPYNNLEGTQYESDAIMHCRTAYFDDVIKKFKPKVILGLGNLALKYLWKMDQKVIDHILQMPEDTKEDKKAKKNYLKNFSISSMRGYILPSIYDIPLVPTWHPSHINYEKGRPQLGVMMQDIQQALNVAQNGVAKFESNYIENPTLEQAYNFLKECQINSELPISHDIETPYTVLELDESEIEFENQEVRNIDSIQFSNKEMGGIFLNWDDNNISIIRSILSLPNPKIGWNNWKFDEININYHLGLDSIKGEIHDVMWMWKWLNQDFVKKGRALQFATNFACPEFPVWKHLAQIEPTNYGCLDVDATLRVFNYLKKVFTSIGPYRNGRLLPDTKSLWEGYLDDIVHLRPILEDMTKRGFPIDVDERNKFRELIEKEQENNLSELQKMYPDKLKKVKPELGYVRIPNEVIEVEQLFHQASLIDNNGPFFIVEPKEFVELRKAQYLEQHTRKMDKDNEDKEITSGLILKEFVIDGFPIKRYCRMEEFKPGSRNQIIKYLELKGYKVPTIKKRLKTGKKVERETTAKDQLQPLWEETGDDLLYKSLYQRELDHLLGTYVGTGKKEGWKLGSDNRVHAEFLFIPASGQLSTSPNIQNLPIRGTKYSSRGYEQLVKQLRKMIAAKPNHVLISADWSAFHINTLAFEAEDANYMRIGRLDPHSYLTAHILHGDLPISISKLQKKKPDYMSHEEWIKKCSLGEEAIEITKNIDSWLGFDDKILKDKLNWFKKNYEMERNSMAKRAILGMGFGMTVHRFFRENRHTFKTKAEPEKILRLIQKLFPKTFVDFHETIKNKADRQTYLITRYGYIRRFYDVYDWRLLKSPKPIKAGELMVKTKNGNYWYRRDGESAKEAIAYLPSNNAFGFKKECMRNLWNFNGENLCQKYGLINEIHDELLFECHESLVNEAIPTIVSVMQSPAEFLKNSLVPEGLTTNVECKMGKNWAEMEKINL